VSERARFLTRLAIVTSAERADEADLASAPGMRGLCPPRHDLGAARNNRSGAQNKKKIVAAEVVRRRSPGRAQDWSACTDARQRPTVGSGKRPPLDQRPVARYRSQSAVEVCRSAAPVHAKILARGLALKATLRVLVR